MDHIPIKPLPLQRHHTDRRDGSPPKHHHPHIHRHHRDKSTSQAALQPTSPNPVHEVGAKKTRAPSLDGTLPGAALPSRPESVKVVGESNDRGLGLDAIWRRDQVVNEAALALEKEKSRMRNQELSASLAQLNSLSNKTTRRLDDTYYAILEKLSGLESCISSLREISRLTSQLRSEFDIDASELETEVRTQLHDFEGFKKQEESVLGLEARVKAGRAKAAALVDRLQQVRARVDGFERKELEWQARASRRLQMLWAIIATGVFIYFALMILHYTRNHAYQLDISIDHPNGSMGLQDLLAELSSSDPPPRPSSVLPSPPPSPSATRTQDRLRLLDEL
ncbi:MAG: hypothetical protein M1838_001275 [Thelocarpon superellum]|nr:MAG: hypothetical protein M1838_001275 [Thelocarpon superellum]